MTGTTNQKSRNIAGILYDGPLKFADPWPVRYPVFTAAPEDGEIVMEMGTGPRATGDRIGWRAPVRFRGSVHARSSDRPKRGDGPT